MTNLKFKFITNFKIPFFGPYKMHLCQFPFWQFDYMKMTFHISEKVSFSILIRKNSIFHHIWILIQNHKKTVTFSNSKQEKLWTFPKYYIKVKKFLLETLKLSRLLKLHIKANENESKWCQKDNSNPFIIILVLEISQARMRLLF